MGLPARFYSKLLTFCVFIGENATQYYAEVPGETSFFTQNARFTHVPTATT